MKHPRISVIIPTYNRPSLLARSVKSVLDQTFTDLELIVVDSSPDEKSASIISEIKDPRIRYIRTDKKNAAASRNAGIKNAAGEYIAFQDDDDEWLPEKLQIQFEAISSADRSSGIVYCAFWRIKGRTRTYFPFGARNIRESKLSGDLQNKLLSGNVVSTQTALVKRECFDKCGLFDENFPALEDWELWIRMSFSYNYIFINKPLVHVYHSKASLTTDKVADIRARELLLTKYRKDLGRDKRIISDHHFYSGAVVSQTGWFAESIPCFVNAIRTNRSNMKAYAWLAAAFVLSLFRRQKKETAPVIGIMVIRNENDILKQVMDSCVQYCDEIFVLDGTDEDPELSRAICTSYPNVTHYTEDALPAEYPRPVRDGCRQFLLEKARERYGYRGWFVLLHGDEIFVDTPPNIIRKYGRYFGCITLDSPVFFIHKEQEPFSFDINKSLLQQIYWYSGPGWPETRIFKNAPGVNYDPSKHGVVPDGVLINYKTTCKIRHFTFRSPEQQIKRAKDRTETTKWQTGGYDTVKRGSYYLDERDFSGKFYRWISKKDLTPKIGQNLLRRALSDIYESFTRKKII